MYAYLRPVSSGPKREFRGNSGFETKGVDRESRPDRWHGHHHDFSTVMVSGCNICHVLARILVETPIYLTIKIFLLALFLTPKNWMEEKFYTMYFYLCINEYSLPGYLSTLPT